jgi:serine/threonine-protein kinase
MIPLRIKWTLVVAAVVAVTMALTATFITKRQYGAMMGQLIDNGASLAKFLAAENAVAALAEEWVTIDISVQEIMHTQDFHSIVIVDRKGVVRVGSEKDAAGKPYQEPAGAAQIATRPNGVVVRRFEAANGMTILDFEAPITFGPKEVGRVHLGVFEEPLSRVAKVSAASMIILVLVTVAAVAIATYLVADRYSKPIRLLAESMEEIAKGRYDYRIGEQRNDEFGQVYRAFDSMAQALQKRLEHDDSPPVA